MGTPSIPAVRDRIVDKMRSKGNRYFVPEGTIPAARYEGPGRIVCAEDPRRLREALELEDISCSVFRNALGSLMYHYGSIARCHIDGERHYKLLAA